MLLGILKKDNFHRELQGRAANMKEFEACIYLISQASYLIIMLLDFLFSIFFGTWTNRRTEGFRCRKLDRGNSE